MQYNFAVKAALTDDEAATLASKVREGMQSSCTLDIKVGLRVNTELPESDEDIMRQQVADLISKSFNVSADAKLISKEA